LSAGAVVPEHAIDGSSLLACADVVIGAGGTMSREAALLGTPTYTVFAGRLAAVDAALIALGRLHDLRAVSEGPVWAKRPGGAVGVVAARAAVVQTAVEIALEDASRRLTSPRSTRPVQVIGS
jgi:predicted glycosyltransferase